MQKHYPKTKKSNSENKENENPDQYQSIEQPKIFESAFDCLFAKNPRSVKYKSHVYQKE